MSPAPRVASRSVLRCGCTQIRRLATPRVIRKDPAAGSCGARTVLIVPATIQASEPRHIPHRIPRPETFPLRAVEHGRLAAGDRAQDVRDGRMGKALRLTLPAAPGGVEVRVRVQHLGD
jgi:hypothetical protein